MENIEKKSEVAPRELTKVEKKAIEKLDIPYAIKERVVEYWSTKEKPEVKRTFLGTIREGINWIVMIFFPMVFLFKFIEPVQLSEYEKLFSGICNVTVFVVWLYIISYLLFSIFVFVLLFLGLSTKEDKLLPLSYAYLIWFRRRPGIVNLFGWIINCTLVISLVLNGYYMLPICFLFVTGVLLLLKTILKSQIAVAFESILNPKSSFIQKLKEAQEKANERNISPKSNFQQRLEAAHKEQLERMEERRKNTD